MKKKIGTVIDETVFRRLRVHAARQGRAVSDVIQESISSYLALHEGSMDERIRAFETFVSKPSYFCHNFQEGVIKGTDKPWLFASGCEGITSCVLPLIDAGQAPGTYTIRLYFAEPKSIAPGTRPFTVKLQDKAVLHKFDVVAEAGEPNKAVVKEFSGIQVETGLRVDFLPEKKDAGPDETPIISAIEAVREDPRVALAAP